MTLNDLQQYYCKGYTPGVVQQHYAGQLAIAWYVFDTHNIPETGFTPIFRYI